MKIINVLVGCILRCMKFERMRTVRVLFATINHIVGSNTLVRAAHPTCLIQFLTPQTASEGSL